MPCPALLLQVRALRAKRLGPTLPAPAPAPVVRPVLLAPNKPGRAAHAGTCQRPRG